MVGQGIKKSPSLKETTGGIQTSSFCSFWYCATTYTNVQASTSPRRTLRQRLSSAGLSITYALKNAILWISDSVTLGVVCQYLAEEHCNSQCFDLWGSNWPSVGCTCLTPSGHQRQKSAIAKLWCFCTFCASSFSAGECTSCKWKDGLGSFKNYQGISQWTTFHW